MTDIEERIDEAESTAPQHNYMVECDGLVKLYKTSEVEVMALQGLSSA